MTNTDELKSQPSARPERMFESNYEDFGSHHLPPKNPATRPAVATFSPNQNDWLIEVLKARNMIEIETCKSSISFPLPTNDIMIEKERKRNWYFMEQ